MHKLFAWLVKPLEARVLELERKIKEMEKVWPRMEENDNGTT